MISGVIATRLIKFDISNSTNIFSVYTFMMKLQMNSMTTLKGARV